MTGLNRKLIIQFLLIVLCAGGLKYFYSTANANDLRWILAPTAIAVELVTGEEFAYESYSGYLNTDKTFLIAGSCSGVNFLIAAFLLLSISTLWRNRTEGGSWMSILAAGMFAYLTTIVANTVRIATALRLQAVPAETGLFNDAQIHRLEGITIYFGFLLFLYFSIGWFDPKKQRRVRLSGGHSYRGLLFPLGIYYATTLALPIANGAFRQGAVFWEHALFVLITPLLLIIPFAVFRNLGNTRLPTS